ncbi:hypothetical protein C8R44DRAFT_836761 [Mycena epipterygia]|nr:hypothetical protein C8R44DRAFT_836761 [Mycena epipterygia]
MPNQHKPNQPTTPEEDIREPLETYFNLDLHDTEIAQHLESHYDTSRYGCSVVSVRRLRRKWRLKSTRQQKHTPESIEGMVLDIKKKFPHRGTLAVRKNLHQALHFDGPSSNLSTVKTLLKQLEPDAVRERKGKKFYCSKFYAAGTNDCWTPDQHDKWGPRFGLWLHNGIDPFTGYNNWMKVWWTNKNPRLVGKYYLDACHTLGAIPVFTQSDPGNENNGIANAQTIMRQTLVPTLFGTLQHNEVNWSVMRADISPGLEDLFETGVQNGWYDVGVPIENLVFRWIAIPFVQVQLDLWVLHRNQNKPHKDRHKVTPHGIPELLRTKPDFYGIIGFKIPVSMEILNELEAQFAPPDHEVFQLTPPEFDHWANTYYSQMGKPVVMHDTFWDIYRELLAYFTQVPDIEGDLQIPLSSHNETMRRIDEEEMALLPDQQPLRRVAEMPGPALSESGFGPNTAGPSTRIRNNSDSMEPNMHRVPEYACFTSSEDESEGGEDVDFGDN